MGLRHVSSLERETNIVAQERVENNGTSDLNKTVKTEMNKTATEDVRRSSNVDKINSDVSKKEINHGHDRKLIPMNKLHEVPSTNTCHRKESCADIVRNNL